MKILQKQTLVNGEEELTSSQADFLASLSPSQVRERERMITVTSGHTCSVLYGKSDPLGLLVKTLLESSRWFSPARRLKWEARPLFSEKITEKEYCYNRNTLSKPSVKTLSEKDIPSSRCLFRLVPSEHPTEETGYGLSHDLLPTPRAMEVVEHPMKAAERTKDRTGTKLNNLSSGAKFGLLPTPMASDATTGAIIGENDTFITTKNGTQRKINQNGTNGSIGLARMVQLLPTPNAREADKYMKKYNPKSQMGTALTAMAMNNLLPTPRANKVNGCDLDNPNIAFRNKGNLEESVAKAIITSGEESTPKRNGATSQLNPLFVEEMMGFPLMWATLPFLSQSGDRNQSRDMETP